MAYPLSVQLLVPGLAAAFTEFPADCFPVAASLSRILGRAATSSFPPLGQEAALCTCMGLACPDETRIPAARLCWLGDHGSLPEQQCMLLEPVHLRTDTHGLVLFDARQFPFSQQDSSALAAALRAFLDEYGWHVDAAAVQRWYLLGDWPDTTATDAFSQVQGKTVRDHVFHGERSDEWQARVNEIQMLLYATDVNLKRAREGLPAINSVWAWGDGDLPAFEGTDIPDLRSDDALGRGLARWAGTACDRVPADAGTLLDSLQEGQRQLLILSDCQAPAAYGDFDAWSRAVQRLETDWFAPLLAQLATGRVRSLELLPLDGFRHRLTRWSLWRPWPRIRPWHQRFQQP